MRRKKRPSLGNVGAIAEAWASAWPRRHPYRQVAEELRDHAGNLEPRQLTPIIPAAIVADWREHLAPATVWQRYFVLRRILRHLETFGAPPTELPKIRRPQPRAVTATREQITSLLANAKPHMRLFILLCWQTALRFNEARAVTPASWDEHADSGPTITVKVKGGKLRCIPSTPEIDNLLSVCRDGDRSTSCIDILNGRPLTYDGLRGCWERLAKKAGVHGVNPHDLRRTTLTTLYAISKDLRAVQQYAGHSAMTSTIHYLAPLKEEKLREYQKLLAFHDFNSEVKQ
ncbi:MAG TPA: site-specific integrase [Candidatus Acidoferrum sp.]|nr:site-specific integrase [Candidatus Acidoferrum sp.]